MVKGVRISRTKKTDPIFCPYASGCVIHNHYMINNKQICKINLPEKKIHTESLEEKAGFEEKKLN